MRRWMIAAGALALLAAPRTVWAMGPVSAPVLLAETQSRAVIVVSTNTTDPPKRVCVRFPEDAITGEEALRRAGSAVDATFYYGFGYGAAVCSLCGVGCPADDTCTTCGGDKFWKYWRASAGSSVFKASSVGSSSTEVRDGDVEGWAWNNGKTAPAYASIDDVCGPASASSGGVSGPGTTPATRGSGATRHPDPTTAPKTTGTAAGGTTTVGPLPTASTSATSTSTSVPSDEEAATEARPASRRSAPVRDRADEGASVVGLSAFSVMLGGVLGWIWWARRRRAAARFHGHQAGRP